MDAAAFGAAFDRFARARVVLPGNATHGTAEFYLALAATTRRLVERHGVNIVAVEVDWPDAACIGRWVRQHGTPALDEGAAFTPFPTWMWRNAEVRDFAAWLRAPNATLPRAWRAEFRGRDVHSLGAFIAAVLRHLDQTDPGAAKVARRRHVCLAP